MTASLSITSGVEGRYATALFALAGEAKTLDAVESDAAKLRAALLESADFRALVASPRLSRSAQSAALAALAAHLDLSEIMRKTLGALAANRRLPKLAAMLDSFERLLAAHRGELSAVVTSAYALTDKQTESLRKALKSAMAQDVSLDCRTDSALLGGLVVQIGSRMIDSSIRTKLNSLSTAMKGVQ